MKLLKFKIILVTVLGLTLLGTEKGFAVSSAERIQFPHLTCYGTSQILKSSAVGVYGQSTTNCDTDLVTPAREVRATASLTRNGSPYANNSSTSYYSNYVRTQAISNYEYTTGRFVLNSYHYVKSSYNSSDIKYWESRWEKTY
jgi:hypothetical protein